MLLKLAVLVKRTVGIAFHSIKYCEVFGIGCNDVSNGFCKVGNIYHSCCTHRFKCKRSKHMWMFLVFFFEVTSIGAHHSVASMIGAIMFCCCNSYSSALCLS